MVNNFGTTGHIELILVSIDQKLAELTDRDKSISKKKRENFLILFLANSPIWRVDPSRFIIFFLEKPLYPYQKVIAFNKVSLGCSRQKEKAKCTAKP